MTKTISSILRVLEGHRHEIIGSRQIRRELGMYGVELTERTIRYHLKIMDERGLTSVFGKNGRRITERGLQELVNSNVSDKLGFIINKIESLAFMSDFDYRTREGKVVLNVSFFPESDLAGARRILKKAFRSSYVMSRLVVIRGGGDVIGDTVVPDGMVGIGTMCSITVNAVLMKEGIPVSSRYGGLMEVSPEGPTRFTSLISYDGCSLDPLLVFIRGGMTSVIMEKDADSGCVLASFREIPVACVEKVKHIQAKLQETNIKGLLLVGNPNQPLLQMPVSLDKAGVVVVGGLNPIAALHERNICTETYAMAELVEYGELTDIDQALKSFG